MVRSLFTASLVLLLLGGSVSAQPSIEVHEGTIFPPGSQGIPDNTGSVEFDAAPVATTTQTRIFTIRNVGNQDLLLTEPISVPDGFTVLRTFGRVVVPAGETTTFTVALNAARAGRYVGGQISFATNDPLRDPFNFTLTGSALPEPSLKVLDNSDANFRVVGPWAHGNGQAWGFQGGARYKPAGTGTSVASWTFKGLTPGLYQVSATWSANANRAPDAQYTLRDGGTALGAVTVNQQNAPSGFTDGEAGWQNLGGQVMITGDTLVVQLSDQAAAGTTVVADAVRVERAGYLGRIIDSDGPGFSTTNTWNRDLLRGFQGDAAFKAAGAGTATWTFHLLPIGQYRVSMTWRPAPNLASNVPFRVLSGATVIGSGQLNQRLAPKEVNDGAARWADLGAVGQVYTTTNTLVVELSTEGADGFVVADAVRVERVNEPVYPTLPDTVRLLEQATWGPDAALIDQVTSTHQGLSIFVNDQLLSPAAGYPTLPVVHNDRFTLRTAQPYPGCGTGQQQADATCVRENYSPYLLQRLFFTNAFYGGDQLRQRVAWALHKVLVTDPAVIDGRNVAHRYAAYLQVIDRHALGNFRGLLYEMTLNPVMGDYLDMKGSTRASPNENYARELMQLFTIGLDELHPNGTPVLDAQGDKVPTYLQGAVEEFARALTGWNLQAPFAPGVPNWVDSMIPSRALHDGSAKTLLQRSPRGRSIPLSPGWPGAQPTTAYVRESLDAVIDNVFYHPNTGPFLGKQLIQMLVTSNPTPGYVARVAAVFDRHRASEHQLREVVRAVLLDPEARGDVKPDPTYGRLREPVLFAANLLRAFGVTAHGGTGQSDGALSVTDYNNFLNNNLNRLGPLDQNVFFPPSVFSYFAPDHVIAGTANVLGPEFMIYSTLTSVRRHNFTYDMLQPNNDSQPTAYGIAPSAAGPNRPIPNGTKPNLQALMVLAGDPAALVDEIDRVRLGGRMPAQAKQLIVRAVSMVPAGNALRRAKTAEYLFVNSPSFLVQR